MLKNYLIIAWRSLLREKSTTLINISGLVFGISSSLLLFLMVKHFMSFDRFHPNFDRIYRVVTESNGNSGKSYSSGIPAPLPDAFRLDFPEAEEVTFTSYRSGTMITVFPPGTDEPKKFNEKSGVVFAEPNFFKIFHRPLLMGNADKSLDEPREAVISKRLALKYFDRINVIGELVKHDTVEYKISAVMEDYLPNTDFPFDLMLSYSTIKNANDQKGWGSTWSDEHCYFLLKENEDISSVESRMKAFSDKHLGQDNYDERRFLIQPLRELHFDNLFGTYTYSTVTREELFAFSAIALFLIITACINFVNLATAEAIKRSKEVGIRKSLGSTRLQLIRQFLGETTLITITAVVLSLGVTQLALGFLNGFLELPLRLDLSDPLILLYLAGITAVVSLLSGLYPSFVVSAFKPALALKNMINNRSSSGFHLRRGLVVLQFVISQFFVIGTIILISQMNYFQKKELGFRKDAVIVLPIPEAERPVFGDGTSKMRTLRQEISALPGVEEVSLASRPPSSGSVNSTDFRMEGEGEGQHKETEFKHVDGNYFRLYDLEFLSGEGLPDLDTITGVVVNETFVRVAGFKEPSEIVGQRINMWGRLLPVLGVVRDFHTVSLRTAIEPIVMANSIRRYRTLSVRINPQYTQEVIAEIKQKWETAYPDYIFDYQFLEEEIREFYETEKRMSVLLSIFTALAIFIGCLGLFGLATYMANQRKKEIGVRKVLGASIESIIFLFSREYLKLITIGFMIAAPAAWYIMNQWLNNFAYKITIGPMVFLAGFGISILVAIVTVAYRSFRAATADPVKSLHYE